MRVAVVSSKIAAGMSNDDPILLKALERAGHEALLWSWDDPQVDWTSVDVALVRSPWDYFERADEFLPWLEATRTKVRFINEPETLLWNFNKRYLIELQDAGLPIIPTELADASDLEAAVDRVWQSGASAIYKPVVSGGSWGLHHVQRGASMKVEDAHAPWLVQPFVPSIWKKGELSVIILGGEVSPGIRKLPKDGAIRVQRPELFFALVPEAADRLARLL
jgi:glutathione synthase/RimK-type ligase-like ATP-grasp enzyme